jgi:glycosyltransferase involved in cell wall biosynthesis
VPEPLTIVVPLFNGARFIEATLDSLAGQTVPLGEVIVIDDGSTDGGEEIARGHPVAARVVSQANAGIAVARNHGALLAGSQRIAFLDQDDLWQARRHERLLAHLESDPACRAIVTNERRFFLAEDFPQLQAMDEGLHRTAERIADEETLAGLCADAGPAGGPPRFDRLVTTRDLLRGTMGVTCSYVFDRHLFLTAGGCVSFARTMDDYIALLNISRLTPITMLDEPSVLYRVHPSSTTMSAQWALPFLTVVAATRHGGNLVPPGHARDPEYVSLSLFWRHWLLELARSNRAGLLDALALTRLLASSDESWPIEALRLVKTGLRAKLRRLGLP